MKKLLIINANYYEIISYNLIVSAKNVLNKQKIQFNIINVPGIFEIPVTISKYIKKYDGFIALGCVVKGETPHFDLICKSTFDGIMRLSINYSKPIGNGIITASNISQAEERCSITNNSQKPNKGSEAAKAVISVLNNDPE